MAVFLKYSLYCVLAYLAIIAFMYFYQRNMMYFPDETMPDIKTSEVKGVEEVQVQTSDNLTLTAWYRPSQNPEAPVLIWFHGNGLNHAYRDTRIVPFVDAGYSVLLASYRGYAGNPGKTTEEGIYKDARAWISFLKNNLNKDAQNTVLYGESLGSGVAVQMASEYPDVRALVLEAPYNSTVAVGQFRFLWLPVSLLMEDRFESDQKIGKLTMPKLIIHGTEDRIIPLKFGQALYNAAAQPKEMKIIDGANHLNLMEFGAYDQVIEFLEGLK